jgi:cell wall-associated NlpC family hydrolase
MHFHPTPRGSSPAAVDSRPAPSRYKHSERTIPSGGLAFFAGGSHGHVAIATGDGRLISTDIHGNGTYAYTTISEIENTWGTIIAIA